MPAAPSSPLVTLDVSDEERAWRQLGWDPDQMSRATSGELRERRWGLRESRALTHLRRRGLEHSTTTTYYCKGVCFALARAAQGPRRSGFELFSYFAGHTALTHLIPFTHRRAAQLLMK